MLHSSIYTELGNTSSAMSPPNLQSIIFTGAKHPSTMKLNFCDVNVPKKFTIYKQSVASFHLSNPYLFLTWCFQTVDDMSACLSLNSQRLENSAVSLTMWNFPKGSRGFWNQHLKTAIPVHVCPGSLKTVFKILVEISRNIMEHFGTFLVYST